MQISPRESRYSYCSRAYLARYETLQCATFRESPRVFASEAKFAPEADRSAPTGWLREEEDFLAEKEPLDSSLYIHFQWSSSMKAIFCPHNNIELEPTERSRMSRANWEIWREREMERWREEKRRDNKCLAVDGVNLRLSSAKRAKGNGQLCFLQWNTMDAVADLRLTNAVFTCSLLQCERIRETLRFMSDVDNNNNSNSNNNSDFFLLNSIDIIKQSIKQESRWLCLYRMHP